MVLATCLELMAGHGGGHHAQALHGIEEVERQGLDPQGQAVLEPFSGPFPLVSSRLGTDLKRNDARHTLCRPPTASQGLLSARGDCLSFPELSEL